MCSEQSADAMSEGGAEQVNLRFDGIAPVSVRGPVTERLYQFSRQNPVQAVDARDATPILKTGLLRKVP
jgi:hypothetical protein